MATANKREGSKMVAKRPGLFPRAALSLSVSRPYPRVKTSPRVINQRRGSRMITLHLYICVNKYFVSPAPLTPSYSSYFYPRTLLQAPFRSPRRTFSFILGCVFFFFGVPWGVACGVRAFLFNSLVYLSAIASFNFTGAEKKK